MPTFSSSVWHILFLFQVKAASKYVDVPVSSVASPFYVYKFMLLLPLWKPSSGTRCVPVWRRLLSHDSVVPLFSQKPGMDVADGYVTFMRHSQDMLREKVNEEVYIERLFDVSKMPSPPLSKGRDLPKCGKTTGQRGISPILRPGSVLQPGGRGFFWSSLPLFSTSLSFSVSFLCKSQLPSAFWCALPQCFWAFVYLKKKKTLLTKSP